MLHVGAYEAVERPARLAFTLQLPFHSPNSERVSVEIHPSEGGCELTLTQTVAPDAPASPEQIELGWRTIVDALADRLERQRGEG